MLNPIPAPGDSFDYHIPIARNILNGTFITQSGVEEPRHFYPGATEIVHSLFLLLNIPLTISNILAVLVLVIACFKLGQIFRLDRYMSLLFTTTICSLMVIVRWYNPVSIDVWVAVLFVSAIILLENPKKTLSFFSSSVLFVEC